MFDSHPRLKTRASASLIAFFMNETWTSATMQAEVCPAIEAAGASNVVSFQLNKDSASVLPYLPLPDCFWTLKNLDYVSLDNVIITGSDKPGEEADPLYRLPSTLTTLAIVSSRLVNPLMGGGIITYKFPPAFFSSKPLLEQLYLVDIDFEATLPSVLPWRIRTVYVSDIPKLTGPIPSSLFSNSNSTFLQVALTRTGVSGTIPSDLFSQIPGKLAYFDFSYNALSGTISSSLLSGVAWNTSTSAKMFLSGNQLTGSLPAGVFGSNFWSAQNGVHVYLANNLFSGSIPASLFSTMDRNMYALTVDLSGNSFDGSIPSFFDHINSSLLINSITISLARNKLVGTLNATSIWPHAYATSNVDYSSNLLSGTIPSDLFSTATATSQITLDLSGNRFAGTINPLTFSSVTTTGLVLLKLSLANNAITGPLTADLIGAGRRSASQFSLDLSGNPLGAAIPSDLLSLYKEAESTRKVVSLELVLNDCGFTGTLPLINTTLGVLKLSLNNNSLTAIPALSWSDYLRTALEAHTGYDVTLKVAHNRLSGELALPSLPSALPALTLDASYNDLASLSVDGSLPYLTNLDVGMNTAMTGTLPQSLFDATSFISVLIANYTSLSGDFPNLSGISTRLDGLDLTNTSINFCPPNLTSPWRAYLYICELRNTNASSCIDKYPTLCQYVLARSAQSPLSPSAPSLSNPSSFTPGPSSGPSSSPSSGPTSSASSLTLVLALVASIALVGVIFN